MWTQRNRTPGTDDVAPPDVGALPLGQGTKPLAREPFGEQREEIGDGGRWHEALERVGDEARDGLPPERSGEFPLEPGGGAVDKVPLVQGEAVEIRAVHG